MINVCKCAHTEALEKQSTNQEFSRWDSERGCLCTLLASRLTSYIHEKQ